MPPGAKVWEDGSIRREQPLGMPRGFKPLHPALALTRRPVRVLTAVIEIATLAMLDTGQNLAFGRRVALQFIRDDHARHVL